MTFLITVAAVIIGCFLYDAIMSAVVGLRQKRAAKKYEAAFADMEARIATLKGARSDGGQDD